ncbi:Acylglycerol kinase, mitochondrial [Fragariocoptes setiger]|uniref:Acylglycerol kinase, mitochondrial n=1 Tax=Fragariocoptes setiger TaxID=1670756 RepID=A0ABQ7SAE5_9ACAR|nr:Acylglycerol kinase, mitochondrial [Fragariocoptes setiger]
MGFAVLLRAGKGIDMLVEGGSGVVIAAGVAITGDGVSFSSVGAGDGVGEGSGEGSGNCDGVECAVDCPGTDICSGLTAGADGGLKIDLDVSSEANRLLPKFDQLLFRRECLEFIAITGGGGALDQESVNSINQQRSFGGQSTKVTDGFFSPMSNPFVVFRHHWKKAIFGFTAGYYGLYRIYDYCMVSTSMKANCIRAKDYGDQALDPNRQPRHITVILNPVAGKRKTRKMYEKFVEPLLHLAGIKVSLVETESIGQAESLMNVMSNCDGVAIVGGDGTVHEAINGLLKRPDREKAAKMYPLAIIPTGRTNSIAALVHRNMTYLSYKELLMMTTMSLVRAVHETVDVIEMTSKDKQDGQQSISTEYVINDLRNGVYQDVIERTSGKLFYQRHIRPFFVRTARYLRPDKYPNPCIKQILYTKPCGGCSKCYASRTLCSDIDHSDDSQALAPKGWWTKLSLIPTKTVVDEKKKQEVEHSKYDNPECGIWHELNMDNVTDVRVYNTTGRALGVKLNRNKGFVPTEKHEALNVKLIVDESQLPIIEHPKTPPTTAKSELNSETANTVNEEQKSTIGNYLKELEAARVKYIVDSQIHEAKSVQLASKSDAIRVFTGA